MTREKKKPISKEHIKEFGGRYAAEVSRGLFGANPGTSGIDWTERLRDRQDIPMGQMGHIRGMVAVQTVQKWGCPAEFLCAYWFFLFPNDPSTATIASKLTSTPLKLFEYLSDKAWFLLLRVFCERHLQDSINKLKINRSRSLEGGNLGRG